MLTSHPTILSMVFCIAVLNAFHIDSAFLSMFLCVVFKIVKSYVILYIHMSVFFHKNIFLRITNRQYPIKTNLAFLEIVADEGLEQIVDFPTRKDNT
jgi:hypothetical protein